jgi:hypothetical protein
LIGNLPNKARLEEKLVNKDEIVSLARKNLVEGENWHNKVNVREIVFGFNDSCISTLSLLAALARANVSLGAVDLKDELV